MKKYFTLAGILACTSAQLIAAETARLETVVIQGATKAEQKLKEVTSQVDVMTSDELEEHHYTSVIEALTSLSSINFVQSGGVGQQSKLYLNGMENKYILVLLDGVRVNDVTNFDGAFFDQISLSDVERIEIIKGAQSGIWGADAVAGVINIVTKKAKPHHLLAYSEMGSFGTKKYGVALSHVMSRGDFKLGFDRLMTDGISAAEPKKSSLLYGQRYDNLGWEKDKYLLTSIFMKSGLNISDQDRLEWTHKNNASQVVYDEAGLDKKAYVEHTMWGDTYYTNNFQQRFSTLSYTHTDIANTFKVYANRSDFKRSYYNGYRGEITEYGLLDTWRYHESGTLTSGVTMQVSDASAVGGSFDHSLFNRAIFMTNTNIFNDATVINQSIRYDSYSLFGAQTTGKLGIQHSFGDWRLGSNYGTAFQSPNLAQITPPSSWGMIPNEQLKPENIRTFDLAGSYKNFSLTYFYNTIKNMIATNDTYTQYINITGRSTIQGYEAKLKASPFETLMTSLGYTKLRAVDSQGIDLPRRPHDTVTATIDWYPDTQWHWGANISYIGERYDNVAKTVSTGGYTVVNSVVNYKISDHWNAYLKVNNLFNRYYQTVDGYATMGRSGFLGLRVEY